MIIFDPPPQSMYLRFSILAEIYLIAYPCMYLIHCTQELLAQLTKANNLKDQFENGGKETMKEVEVGNCSIIIGGE